MLLCGVHILAWGRLGGVLKFDCILESCGELELPEPHQPRSRLKSASSESLEHVSQASSVFIKLNLLRNPLAFKILFMTGPDCE